MLNNRPTYDMLQRKVTKQVFRYALLQGQGGPLVFLWTLGVSLFLLVLNLPVYALIWTGVILGIGFSMARAYLNDHKVRQLLLRSAIPKRFPTQTLSDAALQATVQKGAEIFLEIALKVADMGKAHGQNLELRRVLANAYGMLVSQYESAKDTEGFDRRLQLIGSDYVVSTRLDDLEAEVTVDVGVLQKDITETKEKAALARSLADEVSRHLDALASMLQVLQVDKAPRDIGQTTELVRETEDVLGKIRAKVVLRREAAQRAAETSGSR